MILPTILLATVFAIIHGENVLSINSHVLQDATVTSMDEIAEDSLKHRHISVLVLPIIFKSPDTGWAFGALPQAVYRAGSSKNPSSIRLDAYYTLKSQYHFLFRTVNWFHGDKTNFTGKLSFKKWPTFYYGIGNDTPDSIKEKFSENLFEGSLQGIRRAGNAWFIGMNYAVRYGKITEEHAGSILPHATTGGHAETFTSGLGAVIRYDTRDHHFYPSGGSFHNLEVYTALKALGSDYAFTALKVDFRSYFSLYSSHVLAIQCLAIAGTGSVPFRQLPSVGEVLRGYSNVRHIDRNLVLVQVEYRVVPAAWRLGFVAFAGAGDVFSHPRDVEWKTLKYNAGIGIRYLFSREEKINIRADYGTGRGTSGDYIDLGEAF